ncbi:hypothetical protein ACLOJK_024987 [Asimina triloba]
MRMNTMCQPARQGTALEMQTNMLYHSLADLHVPVWQLGFTSSASYETSVDPSATIPAIDGNVWKYPVCSGHWLGDGSIETVDSEAEDVVHFILTRAGVLGRHTWGPRDEQLWHDIGHLFWRALCEIKSDISERNAPTSNVPNPRS